MARDLDATDNSRRRPQNKQKNKNYEKPRASSDHSPRGEAAIREARGEAAEARGIGERARGRGAI